MIWNYINAPVERETSSGCPASSESTFGSATSTISFDLRNRAEQAESLCLQVHSDELAKVSQQKANTVQVIKIQKQLAASEKREAATNLVPRK